MIYVAEFLDMKIGRNDLQMCYVKIGETVLCCSLGTNRIEEEEWRDKIKKYKIGTTYKFDIWINAANELETIEEKIKEMQIPEADFYFDHFAGVVVERLEDKNSAPEVRVETENNFLFDVTGIHGWEDLMGIKPGDYVEIYHGGYFIKDIYPLDYEE